MSTEPLMMKTQTNAAYCIQVRWFAKMLPMPRLCRAIGRIPTWAYRVQPCTMGWRQTELRLWLRLLPRPVRQWLGVRLPGWLVETDVSPNCTACARFHRAAS